MQPLGSLLLLTVLATQLQPTKEEPSSRPDAVLTPVASVDQPVDALVIQRAARQYRMQLYHSFRLDRAEYDRRRAAWDQVLAAWEVAGSRADQRRLLLAWLQAAIKSASPETAGPTPAIPQFTTVEEPAPSAVEPFPIILREPAPAVPEQELHLEPSPVIEVHLDQRTWPVGSRRLSASDDAQSSVPRPSQAVLPQRERPVRVEMEAMATMQPPGQATTTKGRVAPVMLERGLPGVEVSELVSTSPREEGKPGTEALAETMTTSVEKTAAAPTQALLLAGPPPVVAVPIRPVLPRRGVAAEPEAPRPSLASVPQRKPLAPALDRLPGLDENELQPLPSAPQPTSGSLPAPVAPRAIEPSHTTPLPKPASVASIPPRRSVMPPHVPKEPAGQGVVVDRTELSARILGGNLALRECEATLDNDKSWDAAQLVPLVERLKRVCIQRHDCALLGDLLSESDRSLVGTFESPQPVIRILSKRIVEARQRAKSPTFPGTDAQRAAELQTLDELAHAVAELTAKWL